MLDLNRFTSAATSGRCWRGAALWLACCTCCLTPVTGRAADPATASDLPAPQNETARTNDEQRIHFTYFPSRAGKDSPVVILLHMKDSNRFVWKNGFAERLQGEGYAVVTVDQRYHGESKPGGAGVGALPRGNVNQPKGAARRPGGAGAKLRASDYHAMTEDILAVKEFLLDEHKAQRLNIALMGLVGPEMGASVAVSFAKQDWERLPYPDGPLGNRTPRGQDVKAIVLISPQVSFEGMNTVGPLQTLRDLKAIAFLLCVGRDPQDKGQAERLFQVLKPLPKGDPRKYFYTFGPKLRGTDLLGKTDVPGKGKGLEDHMLVFFNKHLKKLDIPWQDRRPRYDRGENN